MENSEILAFQFEPTKALQPDSELEPPGTIWNKLEPLGTSWSNLERASASHGNPSKSKDLRDFKTLAFASKDLRDFKILAFASSKCITKNPVLTSFFF